MRFLVALMVVFPKMGLAHDVSDDGTAADVAMRWVDSQAFWEARLGDTFCKDRSDEIECRQRYREATFFAVCAIAPRGEKEACLEWAKYVLGR